MKRSGLHVLWILIFTGLIHVQLFSLEVPSRIISVTVFTDRAMITRRVSISVVKGDNNITLQDLPAQLDASSIQVKGTGVFSLRNVKISNRYMTDVNSSRMKELLKKKEDFQNTLEESRDAGVEAKSEKAFVQNIAAMLTRSGENAPGEMDPDKWIKMVNFYREKLQQLDGELRSTNRTIKGIEKEITKIDREIQSIGYQNNTSVKVLTVTLTAPSAGKGTLDVSYLVPGPHWIPEYTIKIDDRHKSASLMYRAVVYQSTGEDWKNVTLSLSTAKPAAGGVLPELDPWYLDVINPSLALSSVPAPLAKKAARAAPVMNYTAARVQTGLTSVVFKTSGENSVASDNQGHSVTVALFTIPAEFMYSCVPKKSPYVFMQAEVTNSSMYPLLAGEAHIFLNGNFVVKSSLKHVSTGEKFKINCGVDEGFTVKRKQIDRFESTSGFFTKKTKITYKYLIEVTNNKDVQKKVEIQDQLPVSKNKDIVITPVGTTDTVKKNEYGYIMWTKLIGPGQTVKIPFSFSVSFPQNVHVDNLE